MAAPAIPEHLPIYICEMMERLGIEQGGGVIPRLSSKYLTVLRRCEACPAKKACRDGLDSLPASVSLPRASARMPISSLSYSLINLGQITWLRKIRRESDPCRC
jgi:hypothetical protein